MFVFYFFEIKQSRLVQLATEFSVIFFGLFFARLKNRQSVMRIMYFTIPISTLYILTQVRIRALFLCRFVLIVVGKQVFSITRTHKAYFELIEINVVEVIDKKYYNFYSAHGMAFMCAATLFFALVGLTNINKCILS